MSCVHQGSLYSATVKSIDILIQAMPYAADINLLSEALVMIADSAFNDFHDTAATWMASFEAPRFPWEIPRCCVTSPGTASSGDFGKLPRDVLQSILLRCLDAGSLVSLSYTCKDLAHATFLARQDARKVARRLKKDTGFGCAYAILRNIPAILSLLALDPDVPRLWTVLYHARAAGGSSLAMQTLRNDSVGEETRVCASLYLGTQPCRNAEGILALAPSVMSRIAYAYARCVTRQGGSDEVKVLINAWMEHGEELQAAEGQYDFLTEAWTYQWQFAFARALCRCPGDVGVKSYVPLLRTCAPLRSNINTIIHAPLEAVFPEENTVSLPLNPLQRTVLREVVDYCERTGMDSHALRLFSPFGLPVLMPELRALLEQ